jgi:hypothetical protein
MFCSVQNYEAWSFILREEHEPRYLRRVLRKISEPKREAATGGWINFIMRKLIYALHQILLQ